MQLVSHEQLTQEFLKAIPLSSLSNWSSRPCTSDSRECSACIYRPASTILCVWYRALWSNATESNVYYLCKDCMACAVLPWTTKNFTLPSVQDHAAAMAHAGYTNLVKIAIGCITSKSIISKVINPHASSVETGTKIMPLQTRTRCARCICAAVDSQEHPELCLACYLIMCDMTHHIRKTIMTFACAWLPSDCIMTVLCTYVTLLLE